ncbi:MAG TPA: hypothetical protein VMN58_07770 [Acidimicrobiales bacterium]|nr:hypothetical protein [Acidimicrobiales bacterium]
MGQSITVVEKPTRDAWVVRFETNRTLTGMGHERYRVGDEIAGERPPDELARQLFARGGIDAVHMFSNVITVDLAKGADTRGIVDTITDLFTHYRPGVLPPTDEELTGAAPPA